MSYNHNPRGVFIIFVYKFAYKVVKMLQSIAMNFIKYREFLDIFMQDIDAIFEHQKDYIFCKEGCSHCCEYGEYPFTQLEFEYLMQGYETLDETTKLQIQENIKNIKQDDVGYYICPFLINKRCSVYTHRALVCRTFGLLNKENDGRVNGPFCGKMGLNYSNVFDKNTKELLPDIIKKNNYKNMPKVFDMNITNIEKLDLVQELNIEFGEQKALLDWLREYEFRTRK